MIAVIGGDSVHHLGYLYVLMPVALGAVVMLAAALFSQQYPKEQEISGILDVEAG